LNADAVILDVKMPSVGRVVLLRKAKQKPPLVEVIMFTGHG
jgi:DNA-binding NtrC family response regulator